jgi:hypothetical protein
MSFSGGWVQTVLAADADGPVPVTINVSAGSLIVLRVWATGFGKTISASDGQGSYTSLVNFSSLSGTDALLYLKNANSGTHTIQVTSNDGTSVVYIAASEYSGADHVNPIYAEAHQQQVSPGSGNGAVNSGNYNGGDSSRLVVGMGMMINNVPINQYLTAVGGATQRYADTWGGAGVGTRNICISDQLASGTDNSKFTSSLGTETDSVISFSLNPITTYGSAATTDGHDTSAVSARVTTGAAIAATDAPDHAAASSTQLVGGSISATDAADKAAVSTGSVTNFSIAATDAPDSVGIVVSLSNVPAGRSRLAGRRMVWVDGKMHYAKDDQTRAVPQDSPQDKMRRNMLEWVKNRQEADARRITNKAQK